MKSLKPLISMLVLCCTIASATPAQVQIPKNITLTRISISTFDTTGLARITKKALSYIGKSVKTEDVKTFIDSAELICKKANIEMPPLLHFARARYFFLQGDFNNSSQEAAVALKLAQTSGDSKLEAQTLNFLGQYNLRTGFFKESIDNFSKAINVARKSRLKGYIPYNYLGISDVYRTLRDTNEYRKTLQLFINEAAKENDSALLATGEYRLGSSLIVQIRDFRRADSLLRRGLEISKIRKDTAMISSCLANLGYNFYLEKKFKQSIECYNESLSYSEPAKILVASANSLGNLGTIFRDIGDIDRSIRFFRKSIDLAKLSNDVYDLWWVYRDMSSLYLRKRDTSNAYNCFVEYKKYYDEYMLRLNSQGMSETKIRFDAESHQKELQLLSLKLSNQRLLIYGYTGLFVLSLAIGILIYSRSRINAKRRMSEMNQRIAEVTQANLRQQMNPHFIFNTLNSIQYYMYQHDKLATNNYLTKFSSLMRKVLENSQHTSIPLRDELDALTLYLELEMIRFKDKFEYEIKVDEEIDTILYKVPTMLIQPYVENSISHGLIPGEGKGLVKINLKLEEKYISCTIEDNGIGREAAQEIRKKSENRHNSLGTQIVSSRLDLVNALYGTSLKTIYTDLKNINGEPEGTRVEIQIPIIS